MSYIKDRSFHTSSRIKEQTMRNSETGGYVIVAELINSSWQVFCRVPCSFHSFRRQEGSSSDMPSKENAQWYHGKVCSLISRNRKLQLLQMDTVRDTKRFQLIDMHLGFTIYQALCQRLETQGQTEHLYCTLCSGSVLCLRDLPH